MSQIVKSEVSPQYVIQADAVESTVIGGDLSKLSPEQRVLYYQRVCASLGLNPLTRPFEYIILKGKLTLYARKDATDQLRKKDNISIEKPDIRFEDDWIIVTVAAHDGNGRTDSDIGVVSRKDMQGDFGNALMKAITKAKRRVTLSICGLGMLDETEVDTIPDAKPFDPAVMDVKPRAEVTAQDIFGPDEQSKQHWIDDPPKRAAFWGKLAEYGLGEKDVHASGVAHVHEWTGTAAALITHVREFVAKNAEEVPA